MAVSDTGTGAKTYAASVSGPASYAAGGFLVDFSSQFTHLGYLEPLVVTRGVLPSVQYEITLNRNLAGTYSPGQAVVKVMRDRYDRAVNGAVSGNPASTTVQAALTAAATTTGSGHTHSMNHDHPSTTSTVNTTGGAAVVSAGGGPALLSHTHTVDLANFTGSTASATHTHNREFEYDHDHPLTTADTVYAYTEIAAATNLSGGTWKMLAGGF